MRGFKCVYVFGFDGYMLDVDVSDDGVWIRCVVV